MAKHKKSTKPGLNRIVIICLVTSALFVGWLLYRMPKDTQNVEELIGTSSKPPYVDGDDAAEQVANFYRDYIKTADKPTIQRKVIELYGNKGLLFYNDYYQHGFNPITCSATLPTKVTTALVSTGSVATVQAFANYPDTTQAVITARVVLHDGLEIDSITCPGDKANLPPQPLGDHAT